MWHEILLESPHAKQRYHVDLLSLLLNYCVSIVTGSIFYIIKDQVEICDACNYVYFRNMCM